MCSDCVFQIGDNLFTGIYPIPGSVCVTDSNRRQDAVKASKYFFPFYMFYVQKVTVKFLNIWTPEKLL